MRAGKRALSMFLGLCLVMGGVPVYADTGSGGVTSELSETVSALEASASEVTGEAEVPYDSELSVGVPFSASLSYQTTSRIVPEESGLYVFESIDCEQDAIASLRNWDGDEIAGSDDDGYSTGYKLIKYLDEGTEYFLDHGWYTESTESYDYHMVMRKLEIKSLTVGEPLNISQTTTGSAILYQLDVEEDGQYQIALQESGAEELSIYDRRLSRLEGGSKTIEQEMKAGERYYVAVNSRSGAYENCLTVDKIVIPDLELGARLEVALTEDNPEVVVRFTPERTGFYVVNTLGDGMTSPQIRVKNPDGYVTYGENGRFFMRADETYVIRCYKDWDWMEDEVIRFDLVIKEGISLTEEEWKDLSVHYERGETVRCFRFTPKETGDYLLRIQDEDWYGNTYVYELADRNYDSVSKSGNWYSLEAGKTYELVIERGYGADDSEADVKASLSLISIATRSITSGEAFVVSASEWETTQFEYVPEISGEYALSCVNETGSSYVSVSWRCKEKGSGWNASYSGNGTMLVRLDAGKTYQLFVNQEIEQDVTLVLRLQSAFQEQVQDAIQLDLTGKDSVQVTAEAVEFGAQRSRVFELVCDVGGQVCFERSDESYTSLTIYDVNGVELNKDVREETQTGDDGQSMRSYSFFAAPGTYYLFIRYSTSSGPAEKVSASLKKATPIAESEELLVTIQNQEYVWHQFTPAESGRYCIMSLSASQSYYCDTYGVLADSDGVVIQKDDDSGWSGNYRIEAELEAGKSYYVGTKRFGYSSEGNEASCKVRIERTRSLSELQMIAPVLSLGADQTTSEAITVNLEGKKAWETYGSLVRFTPSRKGRHTFEIICSGRVEGRLIDEEGNEIALLENYMSYSDSESLGKRVMTATLEEEQTYYLSLTCESGQSGEGLAAQVQVERKPSVVDLELVPDGDLTELRIGRSGYWTTDDVEDASGNTVSVRWFRFSVNSLYHVRATFEDGTTQEYFNNYVMTDNQSWDHQWLPGKEDNLVTITADGVTKTFPMTVKDDNVVDLKVTPRTGMVLIPYVSSGYETNSSYYDEERYEYVNVTYWYFYDSAWAELFDVEVTLADGTVQRGTLREFMHGYDDELAGLDITSNQSAKNIWKSGGNNVITVRSGDITITRDVKVASFEEYCSGLTQMVLDEPRTLSYAGGGAYGGGIGSASSAAVFVPEEDGTYYFHSIGDHDVKAKLRDGIGSVIKQDDDGKGDLNFLIEADLKAGQAYVLDTSIYGYVPSYDAEWNVIPEQYEVCVTKKKVTANGYESLTGMDLSGKYINLAFVIDTTGSMQDEIDAVVANLNQFVDEIAATKAILRISLIDYKDIYADGDGSTVLHYAPSKSIWFENADVEALKGEISKLVVDGGGDGPESVVDALANVADPEIMNFNSAAAKFAFLVTDADYKEGSNHEIKTMEQLISNLQKYDIATTVITEKDYFDVYKDLTLQTGGTRINIRTDFANAMGSFAAKIAKDTEDFVPDESIIPVQSISLGDDLSIPNGKVKKFVPVITPNNATNKDVEWTIVDESIAKIDEELSNETELVIQGVSNGTTTIYARSRDGGYVASFQLVVEETVVSGASVEACDLALITDKLKNDATLKEFTYHDDEAEDRTKLSVPAETQKSIFELIRDQEKQVTFVHNDDSGKLSYSWNFNGKTVSDAGITVDFGLDVNKEDAEVTKAAKETSWETFVSLDFKHSGSLPGEALMNVATEKLQDGTYDLYYFNEKKEFEVVGQAEVKDHVASFVVHHLSSYVIAPQGDLVAPVSGISLDQTNVSLGEPGTTVKLVATVSPYNAEDKTVVWSSDDETVATVKDGVVTAIGVGTTKIRAKAGAFEAICDVTVTGHVFSEEWTVDKEPTCTEPGLKSRHCTNPGCMARTDEQEIPAKGHSFGEWIVVTEPDYGKEGQKKRVCSECGHEEFETIPALDDGSTDVVLGDADGNGKVELSDAVLVLKAALGITPLEGDRQKAADADGNGKVELADAVLVLKAALGILTLG